MLVLSYSTDQLTKEFFSEGIQLLDGDLLVLIGFRLPLSYFYQDFQ